MTKLYRNPFFAAPLRIVTQHIEAGVASIELPPNPGFLTPNLRDKSSIGVLSPRLFSEKSPSANMAKGFFAWISVTFRAPHRVQSATDWRRVLLRARRNTRREHRFLRFKQLGVLARWRRDTITYQKRGRASSYFSIARATVSASVVRKGLRVVRVTQQY